MGCVFYTGASPESAAARGVFSVDEKTAIQALDVTVHEPRRSEPRWR
jgi:hypothetical protein